MLTKMTAMKNNIPGHLVKKIQELSLVKNQYAAFDLDNTLLVGDIGEAVFALLVKRRQVKNFGWNDYANLIKTDRERAYVKVIEVMGDLELSTIETLTHEIVHSPVDVIELEGCHIPLPKPHLLMQAIVSLLNSSGIDVNVVTASNSVSAKIICREYFGLTASHVFGADMDVGEHNRIKINHTPIPYGKEKVNVLQRAFTHKPVVTGGDALWDRYLLSYTTANGMRLWTGKTDDYHELKEKYYPNLEFYQL